MLKRSEAIVLRSHPIRESDLLVSFFTRNDGKIKGVAKAAKRSQRRFGGALEPLTHVTVHYDDREGHELARIDSCEVIDSPLTTPVDYHRAAALAFVSEVMDQLLADRDVHDDIFRLALSVLPQIRAGAIWMPLTYFSIWMVRLVGLLPELNQCLVCGDLLEGSAYFHPQADGLTCPKHRKFGAFEMPAESRSLAARIFRSPIDVFAAAVHWPRAQGAELRKFASQSIERHIERKLVTNAALAGLE